jgi:16S rRNA C967 or C1407 C5-methylase (RsmB/RsmF family)
MDFFAYLRHYWRDDAIDALQHALAEEPDVSIRLNPMRHVEGVCADGQTLCQLSDDELAASVEGYDGRVPWCRDGIYLSQRPAFTADPLLHAGTYYVQEASSMFIAHALRQAVPALRHVVPGDSVPTLCPPCRLAIDLCAAPGGKSTLLRAILPQYTVLVCNEAVRARAQVLAENIAKWRASNTIVTNAYPQDLIPRLTSPIATSARRDKRDKSAKRSRGLAPILADVIVCDVPCSGEGMFRKEEEAVRQWSPQLVADCAALQRQIVATAWQALRPGGVLLYSTCTFNPQECELNIVALCRQLGAHTIEIPVPYEWGVKSLTDLARPEFVETLTPQERQWASACYHLIPGNVRGEGFFCAVLAKPSLDDADTDTDPAATLVDTALVDMALADTAPADTAPADTALAAAALLADLQRALPSFDDMPAPTAPDIYDVQLSLDEAMRYLQRESLVMPPGTPLGIVQVCHRGQPLGLMKNVGSRANNLYPKEWRIRSSHLTPHSIL